MTDKTTDAGAAAKDAAKRKGKVHLGIVMDESGSMGGLEESVVTGCNEFLHAFKDNKKARIWLAWFDYHPGAELLRVKVKGEKPAAVTQLTIGDYKPRGKTPLNDAVLDMLGVLDKAVGEGESAFLAIITDGNENASESSSETVAAAIKEREDRGWAFVYLGANQNAEAAAAAIGLTRKGQALNFGGTRGGVRSSLRATSGTARSYAAGGQSVAYAGTQALYEQTGGTLPDVPDDDEDKDEQAKP